MVRRRRIHQHQKTVENAAGRYRRQVLEDIIGQAFIDERRRRDRVAGEQHRVAVGRRLRDDIAGDGGIGAGTILDDKILTEIRAELGGDSARQHVGTAAGCETHDDMHRPIRILLCLRHRRDGDTKQQSSNETTDDSFH
jgi:hypothetical protein